MVGVVGEARIETVGALEIGDAGTGAFPSSTEASAPASWNRSSADLAIIFRMMSKSSRCSRSLRGGVGSFSMMCL